MVGELVRVTDAARTVAGLQADERHEDRDERHREDDDEGAHPVGERMRSPTRSGMTAVHVIAGRAVG